MKTILVTAISLALVAPLAAQTATDGPASSGLRIQTPQEAVNDASILPPSEADALGRPENELIEGLSGSDDVTTGAIRQPSDIIDDAGTTPSPVIRSGTDAATTQGTPGTATSRSGRATQGATDGSSNGLPLNGAGAAGSGGAASGGNSAF